MNENPSKSQPTNPSFGIASTTPSAANNPPPPPQGGGATTSSTKRKKPSIDRGKEPEELQNITTPTKYCHQTNSSSTAAGDQDSAAVNTGGSPRRRKEEIINLLNDILDFYNKKGRYPYDFEDVDELYKKWIAKRTRVYRNEGDLRRKIKELHVKFVKNLERIYEGEDIKSLMDSIDVKIYELSYRVWGKEDDIGFNRGGNESKDENISKDSSKQETDDDNDDDDHEAEDSKDSSEQESDDGDEDSAEINAGSPRRNEEINLLIDILSFYNRTGRYPYDHFKDLNQFNKNQIGKLSRVYENEDELSAKMAELHERFLNNLIKTRKGEVLEDSMDPIEFEIYLLSYRVWVLEEDDDGKDSSKISNDSFDQQNDSKDLSSKDSLSKDSTKGISEDLSSKDPSCKDSKYSSSKDSKDSSSKDSKDSKDSSSKDSNEWI